MLFRERQLMSSFKPGDWVDIPSLNTEPVQYRSDLCHLGLELWQPKVGEWCWFINTNCAPLLAQFVKMQTQSFWINNKYKSVLGYKANKFGHYSGNIGPKDEDYVFVYCEPFIGQLPTYLKDQS